MQETWKDQAHEITGTFSLQTRPVAVTFTNDPVDIETKSTWICRALRLAAQEGREYVFDRTNSACPGGSWHCGLSEPPAKEGRRHLQEFLTRGEKLTHSIVSFQRMQGSSARPLQRA